MSTKSRRVCPVEWAGSLDNKLRSYVHNPHKILKPYVKNGMRVLDIGCGPGFFSLAMAEMVGESGLVVAADVQEGMLEKLRRKIGESELATRIRLHRCNQDRIGWPEPVDFALAFYMVHEVPDQKAFFQELQGIIRSGGMLLVVEPPVHVSRKAFRSCLDLAQSLGFVMDEGPRFMFSKSALLRA